MNLSCSDHLRKLAAYVFLLLCIIACWYFTVYAPAQETFATPTPTGGLSQLAPPPTP